MKPAGCQRPDADDLGQPGRRSSRYGCERQPDRQQQKPACAQNRRVGRE